MQRLLPAVAVLVLLLCMAVAGGALGQSKGDGATIRDDAMRLSGASVWVSGVAAYCNKHVEPNKGLLDAAQQWNTRHNEEMTKIVQVLKWSGGLSKEERDIIGRLGFSALKKEVEVETDKPAYCERVSQALQRGILDFDQREYTASALRRIMAFDLD